MIKKTCKQKKGKTDTDKILTIGIISVLFVICSVSYIHKTLMLKEYGITTCVVVGINKEPGIRWGYQYNVCYNANKSQYYHRVSVSSIKFRIGDKFRIKYSIKDPNICEVLWDERIMEDSIFVRDGKELSQ